MSDTSVPAQDLTLDIEAPAAGGTSIARHDGQVVFVSGALPGEKVRVRTEAGPPARFLRATVTEVVEASARRVPDRRLDYVSTGAARFGGMELAHVDLAHSRTLKAEVLRDQLSRIGHIDFDAEVLPAPGETDGTDWRTRVQLAVDDEGRAGMLAPRSHEVIPVTTPPLAAGALHDLDIATLHVPGVRRLEFAWAGDHGALIVRGRPTDQVLDEIECWLPTSFSLLAEAAEPDKNRGRGRGGRPRGRGRAHAPALALRVLRGDRTLTETVDGRDFTVGADGFWQVHRDAAGLLSSAVVEALPADVDAITDLYCGVGLLGISAARATGAPLFGVEGVEAAVAHARDNAADLEARFLALSVDRARLPDSDVIILDPPRAGAGRKATSAIIGSSARTLVYVSCDPATLARDLAALTGGGFAIESLTGFDLFPLTAHLETVTVLRR
ncbi:tRNA/tmRNA/rRNA uracil-C5-methylase, TrmA/RlmC/RlmD family [Brevibacterium siliguriense]|uniref:tRNA/tmRNA/rRNA uracil-C5-methylase, TrmA/RlmC/RlmD family n=1 Tax=Brevibacterium siliguriense TaxID=1136497 RepID=A0A1H1TBF3_9MICO|nr:TRAM domain-containing protein [Brevibacterium siliguriense]SDS57645.1 tRNA/tmRNA/rRNA uracil-C5-methylase, TrmA/RlmC/RlmD family [Brevibacterium siliguriense]